LIPKKKITNDEIFNGDADLGKDKNFKIKIYGQKKLDSDVPLVMVGENTILLENPKGEKLVSNMSELSQIVAGMTGLNIEESEGEISKNQIFKVENGKIVSGKDVKHPSKIVTVHFGKKEYYVLMDNAGSKIDSLEKLTSAIETLVLCPDQSGQNKLKLFSDSKKSKPVNDLKFDSVYV